MALFVTDSSPDVRYYGRHILNELMVHEDFNKLVDRYLSNNLAQNVKSTAINIKQRVSLLLFYVHWSKHESVWTIILYKDDIQSLLCVDYYFFRNKFFFWSFFFFLELTLRIFVYFRDWVHLALPAYVKEEVVGAETEVLPLHFHHRQAGPIDLRR